MTPLPKPVRAGAVVRIHAQGVCEGRIDAVRAGWIELTTAAGAEVVRLDAVARIEILAAAPRSAEADDSALPRPQAGELLETASPQVRPWTDSDIRACVRSFLDGASDSAVAAQAQRSRHQITILRQAFDAARGERVEEDCSPAARAWIVRVRAALAGGSGA